MESISLRKNNRRVVIQLLLISMAGLITLVGLILHLFEMVNIFIVLLSAILANLVQLGLIRALVENLKNLAIQANDLGIELGNRTRNLGIDDLVRNNATYAKTMVVNAFLSLILPWVLLFTALII